MSSIHSDLIERLPPDLQQELRHHEALPRRELVLCRFCHAPITSLRDELVVGNRHQHQFTNPDGIHFTIGCFRQAPGCDIHGPAIVEYSWFDGYTWQLAQCTDCGEHLGWFYQSGERDQFYGLIIDKLARFKA
jgi:hypothetical protein